ncbi:hypothetical protein ACI2KO_05495 [Pseudomonas piscis]|uniref:hypothetical protein n=1 Tax=Pseudomonas piscis TaxID=2614538 RepID=UPI00384ED228
MKRKTANAGPEIKVLWREATDLSNKLFREAAELDDIAYRILSEAVANENTLREFQIAKDRASAKYQEAMEAWEQANIELDKARGLL